MKKKDIVRIAKNSGVNLIYFMYCDNANLIRGKATHIDHLDRRIDSGIGLTVGVLTDPALAGQYGSKGMFFWGGAASTIFWIDPEEELVAVLMTQVMASSERLRETYAALVYQAIDD